MVAMAKSIPEILDIIRRNDYKGRSDAIYSLIYHRKKSLEAVPFLIEYLKFDDAGVRFIAAFALGVIGAKAEQTRRVLYELTRPMDKPYEAYDLYSRIRHYDRVRVTPEHPLGGEIISGKGYGYALVPDRECRDGSLQSITLVGPLAWNISHAFVPVLVTGIYARFGGLLVESITPDPGPLKETVF